jgi:hypothetical protein
MRILLVRGAGLAYNGAMDADTKVYDLFQNELQHGRIIQQEI